MAVRALDRLAYGALALYERVSMNEIRSYTSYAKELTPER
jgi:hypothetical protein